MKIGIDAKWLFSQQVSGRIFLQNVLPELIALHPEIEWHLFLDRQHNKIEIPFLKDNVHLHYVWAGFNMLSNLFVIPKHARRLNLDVVLFQTFSPKSSSFKSVAFIHDVLEVPYSRYFTWRERLYFTVKRWSLPRAARVITTTQYVKNELLRLRYVKNPDSVDIAPLGVTTTFKPAAFHNPEFLKNVQQEYKLPSAYLLFVGRLNARKNLENLLRAFRLINDKTICLVIAGEKDWKAARISDLLNDEVIRSRVHFTGPPPDRELSCMYAMARIFCFPSLAEGFGLPPLEAMASGIPVVVSDATSLPEVCGDAALYCTPSDPKTIARQINSLLEDESLYQQKVQQGLEWSKQYSWKCTAEKIMKSIFTAMEKHEPSR